MKSYKYIVNLVKNVKEFIKQLLCRHNLTLIMGHMDYLTPQGDRRMIDVYACSLCLAYPVTTKIIRAASDVANDVAKQQEGWYDV